MDAIEAHVRTIIARALGVLPEEVQPQSLLFAGIVSYDRLRAIARTIEKAYGVHFALDSPECWATVADVVEATERLIKARRAA